MPPGQTGERHHLTREVIVPVIIREASQADAPAAKACVIGSFDPYVERIGKPPAPMLLDFPAEIEARHVWVAETKRKVVEVLVQYETGEGFYIDTVAVAPLHQGSGVGRALLQFAEQEALRRGYGSIYLCTNARMTENQIFYPRIGYSEYARKLDQGYDRVFYRKSLGKT
jgi:GNAT superfamily N-acetyltransferase